MKAIALFLAWPLIEIGLFVTLGAALGLWLTLAFVLASAVLGVAILRRGGRVGRPRGGPMVQAAGLGLSMVAAILLIVPGFLSSFLGLLLLMPVVQRLAVAILGQRLMATGFVFRTAAEPDDVVDGIYEEVRHPADQRLPPSKWTQD